MTFRFPHQKRRETWNRITSCHFGRWKQVLTIYLSGAAMRKQRQIRNQNEAKSRRTLDGLNRYTKIQRNNKSQSQGIEISSDEVVCEDDTTSTNANTITTTHITTDLDERMAGQVIEVTVGRQYPFK